MKKTTFSLVIVIALVTTLSSCCKDCGDPNAVNYGQAAPCAYQQIVYVTPPPTDTTPNPGGGNYGSPTLVFMSDSASFGTITVTIDSGLPTASQATITTYYGDWIDCSYDYGCAVFSPSVGSHYYTASCTNWYWNGTVTINAPSATNSACNILWLANHQVEGVKMTSKQSHVLNTRPLSRLAYTE